jgi:hypothetical protein
MLERFRRKYARLAWWIARTLQVLFRRTTPDTSVPGGRILVAGCRDTRMRGGDEIIAIDGKEVTTLPFDDAVRLFETPGTTVRLRDRSGDEREFTT